MRNLNYEIKVLCDKHRQGSYGTQANRRRILSQAADDLYKLGFRKLRLSNIKQKHIVALVENWKTREICAGTIKNRMSVLRWMAAQTNRPSIIARDNDAYGIERRSYLPTASKGQQLDLQRLNNITDPYIKHSLELQAAFGLRRCECLKFQPNYADRGDKIVLKASWTKGGRAREIPIRNAHQRAVLDRALKLAGRGSMIPTKLSYIEQQRFYEKQTAAVGMSKLHGLRHQFAQDVYKELTGREAPVNGGPRRKALTKEQRAVDDTARQKISEMLGHGRIAITAIYLGT